MPDIVGRLRTPRLPSAPATPTVGEIYYDTTTNQLYCWNGTVWLAMLTVPAQPSVRVYGAAVQTGILTGVETPIPFPNELWDQYGGAASNMHDNVTNNTRLTCRYAGIYAVWSTLEFTTGQSAAGARWSTHRVNGTASTYQSITRFKPDATMQIPLPVYSQLQLAVNDYVETIVFQDSGGTQNLGAASATIPFPQQMGMTRIA
jgi:hypothetical protein